MRNAKKSDSPRGKITNTANMTTYQLAFLNALSQALNNGYETTDPVLLREARDQAVYALMSTDDEAGHIVANNTQIAWEQQELGNTLEGIPYVVLKGTASAIYYPEPIRRTLGDIDLMVSPEDFHQAYQALLKAGYHAVNSIEGMDRDVQLEKETVLIELHRRFSILQTREREDLLDRWILEAIPNAVEGKDDQFTFPMLPTLINGLVILSHINQHLEDGLGIRQIVDWLMYVKCCLPDEKWTLFYDRTEQLGLTKLAKVCTRFGQIYLGLNKEIIWCRDAKDELVNDLLEYLFECGNFGQKDPSNNMIRMVLSHGRGIKGFFQNLQRRGEANWCRLEKSPQLRRLAWMYQLGRYIKLGLKKSNMRDIGKNLAASNRRNRLMDELGVTREALRD